MLVTMNVPYNIHNFSATDLHEVALVCSHRRKSQGFVLLKKYGDLHCHKVQTVNCFNVISLQRTEQPIIPYSSVLLL